jgi:voltage-gated sodium channel
MIELSQKITKASWFNRFIIATIILAGVLAGVETDAALVERHKELLKFLDGSVLAIFVVEIILKMLTHGKQPWRYFRDGWNVFDFTIVAVCLLPIGSQFAAVLRLARAFRLLRLITALPKLQLLVGALLKSLSSMGYVGLLLGLMFYIYGVAGVYLFGKNDPEFFGALSTSLITLMRLITLDDWGKIFDTQYLGPWLDPQETIRAVSQAKPITAVLFFISFILLGTMIMLNLFIGIVMNSMSEMHEELDHKRAAAAAEAARLELANGEQRGQEHKSLEEQFALMEAQLDLLKNQVTALRQVAAKSPNTASKRVEAQESALL